MPYFTDWCLWRLDHRASPFNGPCIFTCNFWLLPLAFFNSSDEGADLQGFARAVDSVARIRRFPR